MASGVKRLATSAIDWTRFAAVCPKWQLDMLRATKAKHDTFVNRVHQLPESLPKIDFAGYKARLPDPAMADRFQKAYEALSIAYPVDKANLMQKIEAENTEMEKKLKQYRSEVQAEIDESKSFSKKMDSLPKFEEMTEEMFAYYFPETWHDPNNPKFWPYIPEEQPSNPDFEYLK